MDFGGGRESCRGDGEAIRMDGDVTGGGRFAPLEVTVLPRVSLVPAHGR
jgi:hypothetical protein